MWVGGWGGGFLSRAELGGEPNVFDKDDDLVDFMGGESNASAFLRIMRSHMDMYAVEESETMIDGYAREPGGVTWSTMRFACRLHHEGEANHGGSQGGTLSFSGRAQKGSEISAARLRVWK